MKLRVDTGQVYKLRLAGQQNVPARVSTPINVQIVAADVYDGDYVVTPQAHEEQILPTEGKMMEDDVTVLRVPYFETSNIFGKTAYIASEVV